MIPFPSFAGNGVRRGLLRWLGWYYVVNWALLILLSLRYIEFLGLPAGFAGNAFAVLMYTGHLAALAALPFVLPALLILFLPRRTPAVSLAILAAWAMTVAVAIDTAVFAQYRFHINGMVLSLLFGGAAGEIFDFSAQFLTLAFGCGLLLLGLQVALAWATWRWTRVESNFSWGYWIATGLILAFIAENGLYGWANAREYTPITRQARTLLAYQPTNFRGVLAALGLAPAPSGAMANIDLGGSGLSYPLKPLHCEAFGTLPNILILVIDSWRFDALNAQVTPHLAEFARESWRFEKHFSGGNETRTGIFSIFYGIPATYWHEMLGERRGPVLVDEALRHRYIPALYGSAPLNSPEFDRTVFARVPNLRVRTEGKKAWQRDCAITDQFLTQIQALPAGSPPFFGFLFYDTPHGGAETPPDYPNPFQPSVRQVNYLALNKFADAEPYLNRYKNEIHFVDSLAGQVLEGLKNRGLLDKTLVIVTGDHGEEFNDTGLNYWGHTSNFTRFQTQVPLLVRWPGKAPRTFTHWSSHVDLAPTLLREVFGCRNPEADYSTGRQLTEGAPRGHLVISAYNRFSLVEPGRITVYYFAGLVEHYDPDARELPDSSPSPSALRDTMESVSRFYAR